MDVESGNCVGLIEWLEHPHKYAKGGALIALYSLAKHGTEALARHLVENGIVSHLRNIILATVQSNEANAFRVIATWIIGSLILHIGEQKQDSEAILIRDSHITSRLLHFTLPQNGIMKLRIAAASALHNATRGRHKSHHQFLVAPMGSKDSCVPYFCDLVSSGHPVLVMIALETLEDILWVGNDLSRSMNAGSSAEDAASQKSVGLEEIKRMIKSSGGLKSLRTLCWRHDDTDILEKGKSLYDTCICRRTWRDRLTGRAKILEVAKSCKT